MTTPAVRLGDTSLSLTDLLRREHRAGRLIPWLRQAALDAFLTDQAHALGLANDPDELQRAADTRRRQLGLLSAEQTNTWLAEQKLTADDFEAAISDELLVAKLRRQVAEPIAKERYRTAPAEFDRLTLRLVVVPREELAREILTQIEEDGADLGELARKHSKHPSAAVGGVVGPLFRVQLAGPVREAVVAATVGDIVGPITEPAGFVLARIEQHQPAELNAETAAFLMQEAFAAWLNERLASATFSAPILDGAT